MEHRRKSTAEMETYLSSSEELRDSQQFLISPKTVQVVQQGKIITSTCQVFRWEKGSKPDAVYQLPLSSNTLSSFTIVVVDTLNLRTETIFGNITSNFEFWDIINVWLYIYTRVYSRDLTTAWCLKFTRSNCVFKIS